MSRKSRYAPASKTNNNPTFLSGFVGSPLPPTGQQELPGQGLQGTGDGPPGSLDYVSTAAGDKFEMNFAIPIGPASRIIFADIDAGETVTVTAFNGTTPLSLTDWTETAYTGDTGALPPSRRDGRLGQVDLERLEPDDGHARFLAGRRPRRAQSTC